MTSRPSRTLRRRKPKMEPKPRVLIVCEGKVTEPSYFRGLKLAEQVRLVEVIIDDDGGTPKTLVERAVRRKKAADRAAKGARDDNLKFDEVWCVFDIDEHPKLTDARQQADANHILLAASNPCFELWLFLHFEYLSAWIHRHDIQSARKKHLAEYEKKIDFSVVVDHVDDAISRAEQLEKWQAERGCSGDNPSTTVHRLVKRIRSMSKSERLKQIDKLRT